MAPTSVPKIGAINLITIAIHKSWSVTQQWKQIQPIQVVKCVSVPLRELHCMKTTGVKISCLLWYVTGKIHWSRYFKTLDLLCGSFWLQSINLRVFCLVLRKKIAPKDYYPNLRADRTDQRSKEDVRGSKTYGEKRFNDFNWDEDLYKEKKLKEHNEFWFQCIAYSFLRRWRRRWGSVVWHN